jgi:hypothetical protein
MNVEIGAEASLFPEKECISGIFVAVYRKSGCCKLLCMMENNFDKANRGCIPVKIL